MSLVMLTLPIALSWGHRDDAMEANEGAQLEFDQDADGAEDPLYTTEKPGWENTRTEDVQNLTSFKPSMRENFRPVKDYTEVASLSMHMMIATSMLETLKIARHVVDIGSGTGALLAVFAELVPTLAVVEGLEFATEVADASRQKMANAAKLFEENGKVDAQIVANKISETGIAGGELNGNLFTFNLDGKQDGEFDVINVGFAMNENEIPNVLWKSLAVNGKLGMPVCDTESEGLRCNAHYHIFTKTSVGAAFPGATLVSQGQAHERIDHQIRFLLVRAPKTHIPMQEGYEQVECPERLGKSCDSFEDIHLPKDAAVFFKEVLSIEWINNVDKDTKETGGYNIQFRTIHKEKTVWEGGVEQDAAWGFKVIYDMDCEEAWSTRTWRFSGFGNLESKVRTWTIFDNGNHGDC